MSLFSSEPLAEGESDQYNAPSIPSSPMSLSNFDDTAGIELLNNSGAGSTGPVGTLSSSLATTTAQSSSSSSSSSSSAHREQLLKIINDPTSNNQVRLTYNVAQEMNTRKLWRFYLTDEEHAIFEAALTSLDTWRSFITLDREFETRLEEINRQEMEKQQQYQQEQEQQHQSHDFEGTLPDSIPDVELTTEPLDTNDTGMEGGGGGGSSSDRLPDIVKVEVVDQDLLSVDLISSTLKKEDSYSARNSPAVSTPPVSTPNGHLRTPLTPNHREGSLSPRRNRDSVPPNGSSKPEASVVGSPSVSAESHSLPPSIPTTAFRSRVMVFEQLLPKLYPGHGTCCHPTIDITELEKKDVSSKDTGAETLGHSTAVIGNISGGSSSNTRSRARNLEDDDYDEDMDGEPNKDGQTKPIKDEASAVSKDKDKQPQEKPEDEPVRLPIHHLYYTLEYDMDAMIEQQQLEEADKIIQEEQENQAGTSLVSDNMLSQLGTGGLSMRYLLGAIEANRAATGLSDRELRTLLSDVRPNRSKWANEDKVGQEELYEGCERILMELRNYTEHSTPFLNKVNKREAPDYFQIIKNPMDLGTVLKKLKAFQYKSKDQFAKDLELIYDNCLLYNSDPSSVYRKHAIAMRKRTAQLLETVQDVVIRDRAEVEAEAEAEESDDDTASQAGRLNESVKGPGRKEQVSSKKVHKINGESSRNAKDHHTQRGAAFSADTPKMLMELDSVATPTRELSREPSTMDPTELPFGRAGTPNGMTLNSPARYRVISRASVPIEIDLEQEEREIAEQLRADRGDLLFQAWKDKTKKARARICSSRENQQQLPFEERFALERTAWEMKKFKDIELAHNNAFEVLAHRKRRKKKKTLGFGLGKDSSSTAAAGEESDPYEDVYGDSDSEGDEEDEEDYVRDLFAPPKAKEETLQKKKKPSGIFLPEYTIRSGLPEIPGRGCEKLDDVDRARKLFDESEVSA
ncbi:hypothetical protein B0O80DRAFT_40979 [Mortierella sp. GBAus27b]|nr:hypothetical protein B0O80DRAFT_40979 [Mortierella sp. GBAus27b]